MSILTNDLPCAVEVDGVMYSVRTDFRGWLKFYEFIRNRDFTAETVAEMLLTIYKDQLPPTIEQAFAAAVDFFSCGEKAKGGKGKPVIDFAQDAGSIYAAFRQQYGINLVTDNLHWYEFRALFDNLTDDTQMVKIMEFRSVNLAKIKDKETKDYYRKMKRAYRLKDTRSDEEREQELAEALFCL